MCHTWGSTLVAFELGGKDVNLCLVVLISCKFANGHHYNSQTD